ncbi:tetratricopeptide repeat protein [Opitutus terrae]|uniref:Tetratricopeptide TPR_2 repeat protein n=1 Tax=Opitutus terrae (strain DSM 11246 / JCM 15787 / PB90-1) TaxID=452637 RepID=B1ZXW3_OPITP|nr:tetratricopeptide repeat protein [Opitutus terrae]ACB75165.1 Tetratricopeptide TPR_2 repeat protein [Opitutus terrae PB90-1]
MNFVRPTSLALLSIVLAAPLAAAPASVDELAAARALFEAHKDAEAQSAYAALTEKDSGNPEPLRCLGYLALRRNDGDAAVRWFEKAVGLAPTHAETHRALGDAFGTKAQQAGVLSKFGLAKKCLASYQRAARLDPADARTHQCLFEYYRQAPAIAGGGTDKAAAEAAILKQLDPARGALAYATLYQAEKKFTEALAEYDAYLKTAPDDFYVNYLVGKLCDTNGVAAERGLAALRHCLELPQLTPPAAPKHQHAHWRIGNLSKRQGNLAAARAAYEASLKIDPGFEPAASALKSLPSVVAQAN